MTMLDLELLQTFVAVVDAGGFTRASERVHRTQSTVSQQIRKLEEQVGHVLLLRHRAGKTVQLTEDGEKLLGYARRLVLLAAEAQQLMQSSEKSVALRLGVPEDFDSQRLMQLLGGFTRLHPAVRLDIVTGMSTDLRQLLEDGSSDLIIIKRDAGAGDALACWPEKLAWIAGKDFSVDSQDPVPLAVFPQGCIYRNRLIHSLEAAGRRWRIAFSSQSLAGIQAAVAADIGMSLVPSAAVLPSHHLLGEDDGFATPPATELALLGGDGASSTLRQSLVDYLIHHVTLEQHRFG